MRFQNKYRSSMGAVEAGDPANLSTQNHVEFLVAIVWAAQRLQDVLQGIPISTWVGKSENWFCSDSSNIPVHTKSLVLDFITQRRSISSSGNTVLVGRSTRLGSTRTRRGTSTSYLNSTVIGTRHVIGGKTETKTEHQIHKLRTTTKTYTSGKLVRTSTCIVG
jgi:hypothetical protein